MYFILQNTKLDKLNFKLIIMKNLNVFLFLMLVPLLISCGGSDGGGGDVIKPPISIVTTEDLIDTHTGEINGKSTLTRYAGLITFKIETDNLIPGHVYQVMCAIFNKPENCVGPCDRDDFHSNNTLVEAISFVMAGKRVNSTSATFEGTLNINETSYDWLPRSAPTNLWGGLQNPLTATVGLLLRSQGIAQSGLTSVQTTTYQNACSFNTWGLYEVGSRVPEEIGECAYIRDSQHVAP